MQYGRVPLLLLRLVCLMVVLSACSLPATQPARAEAPTAVWSPAPVTGPTHRCRATAALPTVALQSTATKQPATAVEPDRARRADCCSGASSASRRIHP